jgi:hypothetical protein
MATTSSKASVSQTSNSGKCPQCGSKLAVQWAWAGGVGERLVARCTMDHAPKDASGQAWCSFGVKLEGNEYLFTQAA